MTEVAAGTRRLYTNSGRMHAISQGAAKNLTVDIQNQQLRLGVAIFAIALAGAVLVRELGIVSPMRFLLVVPFLVGLHAMHLGLTGVCGMSAAAGLRLTCDGAEPVADRAELRSVRRRGAMIMASTVATALAVTMTLLY